MKVIVGAGGTGQDGWHSTKEDELNIIDPDSWRRNFTPGSITHLLAEHVWEHLTLEEGVVAARNCFAYVADGGLLRVAVPDGNFRNDWYQNMVKVGGPGPLDHPAASHKIVYRYRELTAVFREAGFQTELLEYCDDSGDFHYRYWNEADGRVGRSFRFDTRNSQSELGMVSIILDAKKEIVVKSSVA